MFLKGTRKSVLQAVILHLMKIYSRISVPYLRVFDERIAKFILSVYSSQLFEGISMVQKKKVLMVCLGNSCRSPMAEAAFRDEMQKMGLSDFWEVESAAILGYHVGNDPEPRAMSTLRKAGITNYSHVARQITVSDFYKFDWIFGMDEYNVHRLYMMQPQDSQAVIELLGKYDPAGEITIRDPLFDTGSAGFEKAFQQALRSVHTFLEINK